MTPTRRGFLASLAGMAAVSPWRLGWSVPSPGGAHDRAPAAATASSRSKIQDHTTNDEHWIDAWLSRPRLPLARKHLKSLGETRAVEWFVAALALERIRTGKPLGFFYQGGSEPGAGRNVLPVLLFTVPSNLENPDLTREPVYLLTHCLKRNAARSFRLDRMSL